MRPKHIYKCAKILFQSVLHSFESRTLQLEIYLYLKENKAKEKIWLEGPDFWYSQKKRKTWSKAWIEGVPGSL